MASSVCDVPAFADQAGRRRHGGTAWLWLASLLLALLLHLLLLVLFAERQEPLRGALDPGREGVVVTLAAGGDAGQEDVSEAPEAQAATEMAPPKEAPPVGLPTEEPVAPEVPEQPAEAPLEKPLEQPLAEEKTTSPPVPQAKPAPPPSEPVKAVPSPTKTAETQPKIPSVARTAAAKPSERAQAVGAKAASAPEAESASARKGPEGEAVGAERGQDKSSSSGGAQEVRRNYLAQVLAILTRHKVYPKRARRRGIEGTVLLRFTLDRSGRVLSHAIKRSSGTGLLDRAAEEMIEAVGQFPPFPAEIEKGQLTLAVPVNFKMR